MRITLLWFSRQITTRSYRTIRHSCDEWSLEYPLSLEDIISFIAHITVWRILDWLGAVRRYFYPPNPNGAFCFDCSVALSILSWISCLRCSGVNVCRWSQSVCNFSLLDTIINLYFCLVFYVVILRHYKKLNPRNFRSLGSLSGVGDKSFYLIVPTFSRPCATLNRVAIITANKQRWPISGFRGCEGANCVCRHSHHLVLLFSLAM